MVPVRRQGFRCAGLAMMVLVGVALPTGLRAQADAGASGFTQEMGLDAGLQVGLGDISSFVIDLPAARMRIGFFQPASRWSLEPALGLSYFKAEGADGVLFYNIEGGALYHFRPAGDLRAMGATVAYIRPFVGVNGATGDDSDSEVSAGAGFGIKIPWQQDLAWRLEANAGYGFDNEAFRIGAFAGVSFFPR
jgi:hypothetical protein